MRASGIGIVVVGVGARLLDGSGLLVVDKPQTDTNLNVGVVGFEGTYHAIDALDVSPRWTMTGGHHADATCTTGNPSLDGVVYLLRIGPGVFRDLGTRSQTLRAIGAVFGTQAGLEVDQVVEANPVIEKVATHFSGGGDD